MPGASAPILIHLKSVGVYAEVGIGYLKYIASYLFLKEPLHI